jgi:hypothetical protein
VSNTPPKALRDTGRITNPVHVLDLSLFLPALAIAGVLLWRRRALGYCLAPVLLAATAAIAVALVSVSAVLAYRDEGSCIVGVVMGVVAIAELTVLARFLRSGADARLANALKEPGN